MNHKHILAFSCAVAILLLAACEPYLLYDNVFPKFRATPEKAICVVIRLAGPDSAVYSPLWIDGKSVGGTTGNTVTSFFVDPGEHLVITGPGTTARVLLKFEANREYYLLQEMAPGPVKGKAASLRPSSCGEAKGTIEVEGPKLQYTRSNPKKTQDDLPDDEVKQIRADWDTWSKENPEKAKAETEYTGCIY